MKHFALFFLLPLIFGPSAFAADGNGYISKYEKLLGTPPPCDVVIRSASDANWSRLNDAATRVICLAPGDYRSRGVLSLTAGGRQGAERWLRYYSEGGSASHPVRQSSGERALVSGVHFNGGSWWIVQGITIDRGGAVDAAIQFSDGANADNNIVDRVLAENAAFDLVVIFSSSDNNTVQNSVIRNCVATNNQDWPAIGLFGGPQNSRLVNNEAYGCTKAFYISEHSVPGTILENNDLYIDRTQYTDCNGHYNGIGPCAAAEIVIGTKNGGTQSNPVQILHNRIWGGRASDTSICCGSGAGGDAVAFSNNLNDASAGTKYVLFHNNIVMDSQNGVNDWWDYTGNISVIGNIIADIHKFSSRFASSAFSANFLSRNEWYLNTVVNSDSWFVFGGGRDNDIRCNVVVNSGPSIGSPDGGTTISHNAFYNSPAQGANALVRASANESGSGEYCFKRKLLTGPEEVCIPYVKPTQSSPHFQACEATLGSRQGVGINDDYPMF